MKKVIISSVYFLQILLSLWAAPFLDMLVCLNILLCLDMIFMNVYLSDMQVGFKSCHIANFLACLHYRFFLFYFILFFFFFTSVKWSCSEHLLEIVVLNFLLDINLTESNTDGHITSELQVNYNNIRKVCCYIQVLAPFS